MGKELKIPSEQNLIVKKAMKKGISTPMRADFVKIVNDTEEKLKESKSKWSNAFREYADEIKKRIDDYEEKGKKIKKNANLPDDIRIYSSISLVKKSSKRTAYYDMRFRGQHICGIRVIKDEVYLYFTKSDIDNNKKYFDIKTKFSEKESILITEEKVKKFFDELRNVPHSTNENKETKSREHKLESLVLSCINEKDGSVKIENLQFIQPIKFGEGFYQMVTPFKASRHNPELSIREKDGAITGGGIDILARVLKQELGWRLAVIELKDQNNSNEPIEKVMLQALIYATFMAHLLDDESCGEKWYNIFREQKDPKELPSNFEILVMVMMPRNEGEEEIRIDEYKEIPIGKNIKLTPCTCYLDVDAKFQKIKNATGTFLNYKRKKLKK